MRQVPSAASGGRGVNLVIRFFTSKFQDTSVTRSLMIGNVFTGCTVITASGSKTSMRVMHARRGLPLISQLHEPHLPALQFQRHARSLAWVAWIR